ncbi:MAG: glycosyltransferase family 4 protein [Candidatus Latescibacteria bacterium]|nr:glycosyltransferase family 4 protein [Candidatus Latescibacterota bacterium]
MRICMTAFEEVRDDPRIAKEILTLRHMEHTVDLLCVRYSDSSEASYYGAMKHPIFVGNKKKGKLRFLRFYLRALFKAIRLRADVYHAQDLYTLPVAWIAARWRSVRFIYDAHEYFPGTPSLVDRPLERGVWRAVERVFIRRADRVITVCDGIADRLREDYGIERPVVLRNLPMATSLRVDEHPTCGCGDSTQQRSSLLRDISTIPDDRWIVLYQGALMQGRGLFTILDVFQRFLNDQYHLAVLGDGPLASDLRKRVDLLGIEDRVTFFGQIPMEQLPAYTASADIGLCLIENAGFSYLYSLPNKLFEYLAAGLPVVASDFPEIGRIVRREDVGLLVDPGDPEAIEGAIMKLSDDALRRHFALNARQAAQRYTWERESEYLIHLYRELEGDWSVGKYKRLSSFS